MWIANRIWVKPRTRYFCHIVVRDRQSLDSISIFCQHLDAGGLSEGVLTWDAMTLSAFQKYDGTLAQGTARSEFSGCLHR